MNFCEITVSCNSYYTWDVETSSIVTLDSTQRFLAIISDSNLKYINYIYIYIFVTDFLPRCLANLNEAENSTSLPRDSTSLPSFYVTLAHCQVWWQNGEMRFEIDFIPLRSPIEHTGYPLSLHAVPLLFLSCFVNCWLRKLASLAISRSEDFAKEVRFLTIISSDASPGTLLRFPGIVSCGMKEKAFKLLRNKMNLYKINRQFYYLIEIIFSIIIVQLLNFYYRKSCVFSRLHLILRLNLRQMMSYIQRHALCINFFLSFFCRYNINRICYLSGFPEFRTCLLKLEGLSTNVTPQIPWDPFQVLAAGSGWNHNYWPVRK